MGKAPCCDKDNVKRGPWSPEEDDTLKTYIHQHGTGGNWIAFPKKAGLRRCGKSCRLRWLNYLRPDIRHGGFTEEEDIIIYTLYNQMGSRWSIIASQLHGRTDNDVKNHWNTKLKKKLLGTQTNNNGSDCNNPITVENYVNLSFPTSLNQDFQELPTMLADFNYGLTVTAQNLVNDPIIFPSPIVMNFPQFDANLVKISQSEISTTQQTSSVSASSSVSLDDQKFVQWTSHGGGEDDGFLTDTGFGLSNDFVNGFWSLEKGGEDAPTLGESVLYADIKPQGLLQSVINNTVPY